MKITEVEEKLIQQYSDELLEKFKTALKRVPKNNRCQHCYTTAVAIKAPYIEQAIELIQYGLTFCDDWLNEMRSYTNMAILYEQNMEYSNAFYSYQKALNAVKADFRASYEFEFSAHMLRTYMHMYNFEYTDQLENLYNLAIQADEFSQSFQKKLLYRALAEIIIFEHKKDIDNVKNAIQKADNVICPNQVGPLYSLLKRKRFIESNGATNESITFLEKMKKLYI